MKVVSKPFMKSFSPKRLSDWGDLVNLLVGASSSQSEAKMNLDEKDHKIIEILKEDSRQSVRDIAKKTKIRPSTVHERIKKLKENNIIEKFTLKLNNEAMGENFIVFMLVAGKPTKYINEPILHNKKIKEVFGVTGEYDLLFKLKFRDVVEFNDYIINFRKSNPDIAKTLTMVATANLKEEI